MVVAPGVVLAEVAAQGARPIEAVTTTPGGFQGQRIFVDTCPMHPMFVALLIVLACGSCAAPRPVTEGPLHQGAAADVKWHDAVALAIIIDRSGSMGGAKLEAAKRAVRDAIAVLGDTDKIAIIAYDSKAEVVVPLEDANANAARDNRLAEVKAAGGTDFTPALQSAHAQLAGAAVSRKLVVFMSDGESSSEGIEELEELMMAAKITVSTISLPDNGYDELLKQISDKTGGRFYKLAGADDLAKTIVEEAQQLVDGK